MKQSVIVLRVIGFGLLILIAIGGTIYAIYGAGIELWIAIAVCALLTVWAYVLYRKLFAAVTCPRCRYQMTYLMVRKTGRCPRCSAAIQTENPETGQPE